MYRTFLNVLNLLGILNISESRESFVVSKCNVLANLTKASLLFWYRRSIYLLLFQNYVPFTSALPFTDFTKLVLHLYFDVTVVHAVFMIAMQVLTSQQTCILLNRVKSVQKVISENVKESKLLFNDFKRICVRNLCIVLCVVSCVYIFDFWRTMNHSLMSFLSYTLCITPIIIKLTFMCYIHVQLKFFVFCQNCLLETLAKNSLESLEEIAFLLNEICSLMKLFVSTVNCVLFEALLYFLEQTIFQVSGQEII